MGINFNEIFECHTKSLRSGVESRNGRESAQRLQMACRRKGLASSIFPKAKFESPAHRWVHDGTPIMEFQLSGAAKVDVIGGCEDLPLLTY